MMKKLFLIMLAAAIALGGGQLVAATGVPGTTSPTSSEETPAVEPERNILRVDPWMLLQSDGNELFQQMCASCHGNEGVGGRVLATPSSTMSPPPLTHLEAIGVERGHWVYVIDSPCDDPHHRNVDGSEAMPCWRQVFRHTLGNDAATMLVSNKLADYLETIQDGRR